MLVYGMVLRAVHPGHQRVPIAAQLAITAAIIVVVGGFVMLKGRRAGIELRPDGIIVRRCWLPNRRLSQDEVRGYAHVRQRVYEPIGDYQAPDPLATLLGCAARAEHGHILATAGISNGCFPRSRKASRHLSTPN